MLTGNFLNALKVSYSLTHLSGNCVAITAGALISILVTFVTRRTMTRQGEMLSSQSGGSLALSDQSEGSITLTGQ